MKKKKLAARGRVEGFFFFFFFDITSKIGICSYCEFGWNSEIGDTAGQ